jgi:hypothetical protein
MASVVGGKVRGEVGEGGLGTVGRGVVTVPFCCWFACCCYK